MPEPINEPLVWLYTHCTSLGMTEKSDSGSMEHDIALFVHKLVNPPLPESIDKTDLVLVPRGLLGSASYALRNKLGGAVTILALSHYIYQKKD